MNLRSGSDGRLAVSGAGATMLTALAMTPLVSNARWWLGALLVVLAVMVVGVVLRQVSGVLAVAPIGQLVALGVVLALLFTRAELLHPQAVVQAMTQLVRDGIQTSRDQAAPVEPDTGVLFLLIGGTGLIGLLVDALAATLRQTALAGLPLLALYCIPAALLPGGLPWYLFVLAALGFLVLLSADSDERMLSWGRVLGNARGGSGSGGATPPSWLGAGGRRAAVTAVVAALLLPTVLPGLNTRLFGDGGIGSGEGGGGAITRINPILTVRQDLNDSDDTELLRYSTTVADPEPLRIVTADDFTGKLWQPGKPRIPRTNRVQNGLPDPPGLTRSVTTQQETTRVRVGPLRQTYLPLPYPAQTVDIDGDWLYDQDTLNVIGDHITTQGQNYTVQHLEVQPTAEQLAAAPPGRGEVSTGYVALPSTLPESIKQAAAQVAGSGSQYEQAVRLQRWFRNSFTYSTRAPRVGGSDDSGMASIAAFLQQRRGYCVHFASAMAIMARVLNIPSRVAIGFLPGDRQANGEMVISAHDAHAWPELYFSGVGWVRFEPTPRGAGTNPPAWTEPSASSQPSESASASASSATPSGSDASPTATRAPRREDLDTAAAPSLAARVPWRLVTVVALLLLVLLLPRSAATLGRRRRWRAAARVRGPDGAQVRSEAAWEDLRRGLADLGVRWAGSWTPRATRQRILSEYELAEAPAEALRRLVADLEQARYAPPGEDSPDRPPAERRADVASVVAAVAGTRSRPVRLRALAFPASGGEALRDTLDRAGSRSGRFWSRLWGGLWSWLPFGRFGAGRLGSGRPGSPSSGSGRTSGGRFTADSPDQPEADREREPADR